MTHQRQFPRGKPKRAIDPVCGMFVDPSIAPTRVGRDGRTYYFCALSCAQEFDELATTTG